MRKYGLTAATALVIANMVGVGVFTSLGFQLLDITDYRSLLLLWVIGGVLALMGSYCYSELSAAFPGSGGEYHFLQISFGRFVGFLSGAVSATVGFSAPVAAAAFTFSAYLDDVVRLPFPPSVTGSLLVVLLTVVHILKKDIGSAFQVLITSGKVMLLVLLIVCGVGIRFFGSEALGAGYLSEGTFPADLFSEGFWVSLIFVSYAYSGWNATAYIIDEVENARRNVPRSILTGTLLVLVLYTAIHFAFLVAAPATEMRGKQDVAYVAAYYLIGRGGATLIALLIAFFLISTVSSMIVVGPRVIQRLAQDHEALRFFSAFNRNDVPARAILLQSAIAILILLTSQFQWIVTSIGFILLLFNTLTVLSLFILRVRHPNVERSIRVPLYPFLPFLFILFNGWIMFYLAVFRTKEVLHGLLILAGCALLYLLMWLRRKNTTVAAGILAVFSSLMLFSCAQSSDKPEKATDTPKQTVKERAESVQHFKIDTSLEEKAAILTGADTGLLSPRERSFVRKIREEWLSTQEKVLQPVSNWAYNEVPVSLSQNALVFYPFSGPDFAFANAIYPGAATYVLAGLEPAGDPADAFDTSHIGTRGHLLQLSRILYYSNRFGFFRTKDMARQLRKIGVFNILLFYLKNSGYDIGRMRLLTWDASRGDTVFRENASPNVCYIEFSNPTSGAVSHLFYFSRDLSDRSIKKDSSWLTWIERKASGRSMLSLTKSASYLMHGHSFTRVRDFMLAHSRLHIQDDTGIPYRYLDGSKRKNILFGEYERPIPMFSRRYQSDLRTAYDSASSRPLPFRIGYTAVYGKSNIQLSFLK